MEKSSVLTSPVVTIGHGARGRAHGEVDGDQGDHEGRQVGEHVRRVRHDGDGVGQVAPHHLGYLSIIIFSYQLIVHRFQNIAHLLGQKKLVNCLSTFSTKSNISQKLKIAKLIFHSF